MNATRYVFIGHRTLLPHESIWYHRYKRPNNDTTIKTRSNSLIAMNCWTIYHMTYISLLEEEVYYMDNMSNEGRQYKGRRFHTQSVTTNTTSNITWENYTIDYRRQNVRPVGVPSMEVVGACPCHILWLDGRNTTSPNSIPVDPHTFWEGDRRLLM